MLITPISPELLLPGLRGGRSDGLDASCEADEKYEHADTASTCTL
jgi:hypothetical protein